MAFPIPNGTNQTFVDLMLTANSFSDGWLGLGMLIAIFSLFFFPLIGFSPLRAFATSSFITAIISFLFAAMGLISVLELTIVIIIFSLGIAVLFFMERDA